MGTAISPRGDMLKNRVPAHKDAGMPSTTAISADKLVRLLGTPHCLPCRVRTTDEFQRPIPAWCRSMWRPHADPSDWAAN